ncbi:MAG: ATP-binding cassette domain-containing protein [Lachnospiraceae bacterium]|nr:ATP-binding cassette domain-containing protein [Lachnospiraceae bacterium]
MITIKNLSYSVPEKELYKDISFTIEENYHYAFIGSNGTGKSTLIDMILHQDQYLYDGKILLDESAVSSRIGYVSQFTGENTDSGKTVFSFLSEEFVRLDKQIEMLCDRMAEETDLDEVFDSYQQTLDEKDAIDGDHYEVNIRKQLKLAGIEQLENQTLNTLSGGEFKLIQVIREMLLSPKMLFLDEPDVFLDFDHVNALTALINSFKGTLVVITHSRFLLNHCFNRIIHLEGCEIQTFEGCYADYNFELLSTKAELEEIAAKEEAEIERQQAIVNKTRALATEIDSASLGKTVHARQTLLDRLKNRRTKLPFVEIQKPAFVFETDLNETIEDINTEETKELSSGEAGTILSVRDYQTEFDHELLNHISFELKRGEKAAIVGRNGSGKTTIIRDITEGRNSAVSIDPGVKTAMFSQVVGSFSLSHGSVREILMDKGFRNDDEITEYLCRFGFTKEVLRKNLNQLSGGERDTLQIAVMMLEKADLLLLDEPTGHLDLYAQIALEEALKSYKGSVLMVSHDFEIIANCMDHVLFVDQHELRRMSIRKFRQMVYREHFDRDDLLKEDARKSLEIRIDELLEKHQYEAAKEQLERLEKVLKS